MKILFILEHFAPMIGGSEKHFEQLCKGLAQNGHQVTVFTSGGKDLAAHEIRDQIEVIRIKVPNRFFFTFLSLFRLFRLAGRFDLIHTTSYNAALPSFLIARYYKIPTVITFHEVWGKLWFQLPFLRFHERTLFYLFEQLLLKLNFSKVIAVSKFSEQALNKFYKKDSIAQIYNGIPYHKRPERSEHDTEKVFTYFGRLGVSKGLDLLLPASKAALSNFPDYTLQLIVPKQPRRLYRIMINQIEQLGIQDKIILHETLGAAELHERLISSAFVVIPSYSEGFCFAAAEAVAFDIPVVAAAQGALPEVVGGKHVFAEEQTVACWSKSLERAISGDWDHTAASSFPVEQTLKNHLQLYQSLLK